MSIKEILCDELFASAYVCECEVECAEAGAQSREAWSFIPFSILLFVCPLIVNMLSNIDTVDSSINFKVLMIFLNFSKFLMIYLFFTFFSNFLEFQ